MKVYKINEKKNSGVTILYITSIVSDTVHENLLRLSAKSDLVFVFPKYQEKKISAKKFSHLYGAIFYGVSESNDETTNIWEVLDYIHELTDYYSYSILLQSDLEKLEIDEVNSIWRLQNSILETSVFSWRTLNNKELQEIYTLPRKQFKVWKYCFSFPGNISSQGMYSKYKTQDRVMFIRPVSLDKLKEELKNRPDILATFKGSGIKVMLPSLIPEKTVLNMNIKNAKL